LGSPENFKFGQFAATKLADSGSVCLYRRLGCQAAKRVSAKAGFSVTAIHFGGASMAARILMVLSAGIIFMLGAMHLFYTFSGPNLTPRDPALQNSMRQISPVITNETTMWRCWIGFNATHSMALILFGLVFGFLALAHSQLLFQSPFLLVVGLATLGALAVISKVYFFGAPFRGVSISLACYIASIVLSQVLSHSSR
jgi:hypothetical protein